ncbi:MAG: hypothetical protein IJU04_05790, partial [Ruminococcus sp.]|nr:hypothetical protein [Ruminococcus sp.]
MSENNNTINRDNNSQDTEFQDMLKEVFLKKDEIIHDRFKDDKKVADISFKKPEAKNDNPPAKKPSERPVEHSQSRPKQPAPKRLQGNENAKKHPESNDISFKKPASNPKAENAEHSEKKPVPHGSKRPVQNGAKRPVPNGAKRPVQNGSNNVSKPG